MSGIPLRRILLVVTGLSPQVVTETLYALAVGADAASRWIPTEIHLITTTRGADNARLQLLHPVSGWFHRLRQDYELPAIQFDESFIHLIERADGSALDDIRDDDDNRIAADTIAGWVRRLTQDPDSAVHASIAGGRKTMGFFLGHAMSLYGRPQDRLSHVLVSSPYESSPEFFYPTPQSQVIRRPGSANEVLDAAQARVWLGDIPFVRLRSALPPDMRERADIAFAESVRAVQASVTPALLLDRQQRLVLAGGVPVRLERADLAFLAWALQRHLEGRPLQRHRRLNQAEARVDAEEYLAEYARLGSDPSDTDTRTHSRLNKDRGLLMSFFDERRSRIKRAFETTLGEGRAQPYLLRRWGPRGGSEYRFGLDPSCITLR
ncbi:CRISPR-associated ring nuclease Csm6 [Tepidimonas sp.]|uniref:CRISPR-associated ring nuclease Csm6 n=1 Tax=Tepidimonas sp. TaxID=2002775 RepID=UPI00391CC26C